MRWFRHAAVSSFCLIASIGGAAEPQAQVIHNPYAVGPTAVLGQPTPPTAAAPLNAWRGTVQPTSHVEPTTGGELPSNTRTLPNDCLKALRAAVQVRSPAEAYRAADLPTQRDRTAGRTFPLNDVALPRRDEAVKPAAWLEDIAPRGVPAPTATAPQLLPGVTGATRLTRNPYRNGDAATNRSVLPTAVISDNPLR